MTQPNNQQNYRFAFSVLTVLFFMWGFITVMNDVLINTFAGIFDLTVFQSSLVQAAFFGAFFFVSLIYFVISLSSGDLINRIGYKNGMVTGLAVCGVGCTLFYPAAELHSYGFFLGSLFVLATGVTILQIAANPYAAILGPPATASARLNHAQGFNSLGTTIGPIVGAILIFSVFSVGEKSPESVGKTYLLYAFVFYALAVIVKVLNLPSFASSEQVERGLGALKFRHLRFGIIAIFMYVGAEVATGSFLVKLFEQPDIANMPRETGNKFLAYYWGGLMIGRLMGAVSLGDSMKDRSKWLTMALISVGAFFFIYFATSIKTDAGRFYLEFLPFRDVAFFMILMVANYVGFIVGRSAPARSLAVFSVVNIVLLTLAAMMSGSIVFWASIGTGLFNSIMWSNIFTLSIARLGRYTSQASSLLIMAIVGGAVIPPLQGLVADKIGIQLSYFVPAACYVYLVMYGVRGYRIVNEPGAPGAAE